MLAELAFFCVFLPVVESAAVLETCVPVVELAHASFERTYACLSSAIPLKWYLYWNVCTLRCGIATTIVYYVHVPVIGY